MTSGIGLIFWFSLRITAVQANAQEIGNVPFLMCMLMSRWLASA